MLVIRPVVDTGFDKEYIVNLSIQSYDYYNSQNASLRNLKVGDRCFVVKYHCYSLTF